MPIILHWARMCLQVSGWRRQARPPFCSTRPRPMKTPQRQAPRGAYSLLLPEYELADPAAEAAPASVPGAVFNLSTSIIGAGIMSIPATVKVLGVAPALALIAVVALLCDASVEFLLRYTIPGASMSYAGVMGESFGKAGAVALQICVAITNAGVLITYLIIIGDVMSGNESEGAVHLGVLQEWFGQQWWNGRAVVLLFIVLLVLLPLLLLRRVDSLRFTSAVSVLLAVVFVAISAGMAIYALATGAARNPRLLPDLGRRTSFFELFTAVPVIVLAFTFHFNVHPIRAELQQSSDMTRAVRISLVLCSAIYAAVGLSGYLLFGEATMADILSNFDRSSDAPVAPLVNDVVRLSYGLHLVLVFPLINFSLRINVDGLLFPKAPPLATQTHRFVFLTLGLTVFVYLAAIAIPNIWTLFQVFGSTTIVGVSLVFPASVVLRDVHGIARWTDKVMATTMISLAAVTSTVAISSNLISYLGSRNG